VATSFATPSLGDLYGRYLYTDYCSEEIRSLVLPRSAVSPAAIAEGLTSQSQPQFGQDSSRGSTLL